MSSSERLNIWLVECLVNSSVEHVPPVVMSREPFEVQKSARSFLFWRSKKHSVLAYRFKTYPVITYIQLYMFPISWYISAIHVSTRGKVTISLWIGCPLARVVFDNQTFHQKLASELSAFDEAWTWGKSYGPKSECHGGTPDVHRFQ